MTGKQLKNSILQLAIQGKLVPQDHHDEPASELLKRIRKEKEQLVKTGKLKKKDLESTPIAEDEKPFEIPESWEWCRLGEIISISSGDGLTSKDMREGDIPVYGGNGITGYHNKANVLEPTLVIGRVGFYCGSVHETPSVAWVTDNAFITKYPKNNIDKNFLINTLRFLDLGKQHNATAQPVVSGKKIYPLLFPLPPLSEQHRIVEKIEELMPLVEEYDKAQSELDKLNESLPEQLKKSILQQAIMGKLVPQDPNDEPASELLKRIHKEKENLVKSGALKKKDLITTPISDDEKPFDIPESWEWCRLSCLGVTNTGTTPSKSNLDFWGNYIPFLGPGDIQNGIVDYLNNGLSEAGYNVARPVPANSILQVCIGGSIGKCALVSKEVTFNQQINSITVFETDYFYLYYCLQSDSFVKSMIANSTGTATPIINRGAWDNLLIPLPPLSEQHRIVSKIEELFSILK